MDRARFSQIAHAGIRFWNPVDPDVLEAWIARLPLSPSSRVLDVGCGRGELLLRLAEVHGCGGVGVDIAESSIEHARGEAGRRVPRVGVMFEHGPFEAGAFEPAAFDLAVCIGSGHAVGGYRAGLETLSGLVTPGGQLLIGEGYWRRDPDPGYLGFLGCTRDDLNTHAGNIALAESLGLGVVDTHETSDAAWAAYEDTYHANVLRHLERHPDDPDRGAMRARIEGWREAYQRWGRETLGFGLYLLQIPRNDG
ncbi:MAG: class I SAM-dependent methyltransferase [Phycisphaeraceae bacterium]|nr:MAG: class I SAM-dependent methyltransferase [Phycisphaeraceae bacterium]